MRKYLYIINLLILCILFLSSCDDHKEDDLTPNKVYIVNSGLQEVIVYNTGEPGEYKLNIYKSGALKTSATVKGVVLTDEELQEYNTKTGTNYNLLDPSCYNISESELSFSDSQKDVNKSITITLDPVKIGALGADYVLPIKLEGSLEIESSKSICLIYPVIKEPSVAFTDAGLMENEYAFGNNEDMELSIELKLNIDKNRWDVTCEIAVEEDYVNQYNSDNNTNYKLLAASTYELVTSAIIKNGEKEASYALNIAAGELEIGQYMLPIRLKNVSKFEINNENDLQLIVINVALPLFDRKKWKILEVSSEEINGEDAPARYALDGDLYTFWSTQWDGGEPQPPHHIVIDMGEEKLMGGFGYVARDHWRAWPKACVIEVSKDNAIWETVLTAKDLPGVAGVQKFIDFPEAKEARYFKLSITDVYDSWATAVAEIYAY